MKRSGKPLDADARARWQSRRLQGRAWHGVVDQGAPVIIMACGNFNSAVMTPQQWAAFALAVRKRTADARWAPWRRGTWA